MTAIKIIQFFSKEPFSNGLCEVICTKLTPLEFTERIILLKVSLLEKPREMESQWRRFSSVQSLSCPTLCDPMDCITPGLPVHHQLSEFTQTHVYWVSDAIQPSHPVIPFSSCLQSFPASGSFLMSQLFASVGQSVGVSASASVLSMNNQDWFPLGWTSWISWFKELSRVFSNTTVQKHIFFSAQLSL